MTIMSALRCVDNCLGVAIWAGFNRYMVLMRNSRLNLLIIYIYIYICIIIVVCRVSINVCIHVLCHCNLYI